MEDRVLGPKGPVASAISIGTAALGIPYGPPGGERGTPDRAAAARVLHVALERGIRLIDTAPGYGEAEALVGEVAGTRECAFATKVAPPPGGWESLSPTDLRHHVRRSVEHSLRRLRREKIDLLQAHNASQSAIEDGPLADALIAIRNSGHADALGATVYMPEELAAAIASNWLDTVQVPYNALDRRAESWLDRSAAAGVAVIARSVLLRGVLTSFAQSLHDELAPLRRAVDVFRRTAGASWEELPGVALAVVLAERRIATIVLGPGTEEELTSLLDGATRWAERALPLPAAPEVEEALLDPRSWPC